MTDERMLSARGCSNKGNCGSSRASAWRVVVITTLLMMRGGVGRSGEAGVAGSTGDRHAGHHGHVAFF